MMSVARFAKNYRVTDAFDPADAGWFRLTGTQEIGSGYEFSKFKFFSSNGLLVISGDFTDGPRDPRTDAEMTGPIEMVRYREPGGEEIVTFSDLDLPIRPFEERLAASDWASEADADWAARYFMKDIKRIELSDLNDDPGLDWAEGLAGVKVFGNDGNDRIMGADGQNILFGNKGADRLVGARGEDKLFGGYGSDKLFGGKHDDLLDGWRGRDALLGHSGADTLRGGGGDDNLWGGEGRDMLSGGAGNDKLWGGAGADVFRFANGDGRRDLIRDFEDGSDLIRIGRGASEFGDLDISSRDSDARVKFGNVTFYIEDTAVAEISAEDFLF